MATRLVRRARVVPLWQVLGLGLLFLVAVWSLPLGARPADGVSSVLPSMRPVTVNARADLLGGAATAAPTPDRPTPPSRPSVVALAVIVLVVAVAVVIGRVVATTEVLHGIVGPARRGRAPPRT